MIYKQGDERTFERDTEEYKRLKEFADLLTKNSPNHNVYEVRDVYLDAGQGWMWTTISNVTQGYQALCPRDWFHIVNQDMSIEDLYKEFIADKYNPDRL